MLRDTKTELNVRPPIKLVLDTNVVLDWLVFQDAGLDVLRKSLRSGSAVLVSSQIAYAELERVLAYPTLGLDAAQQVDVLAVYDNHRSAANAADPEMNPETSHGFPTRGFPPSGFPKC